MEWSYIIPLLILLGTMATFIPVFMCLFYTSLLCVLAFTDYPIILLVQSIFKSMDNFALVVVLFFILCGNIMTTGTIVEKLIKFTNVLVSWLPGGLGMAGVIACAIFGAISGSTVATVVALGGFMIPALMANGYRKTLQRRAHDDIRQSGGDHSAQHRHDSFQHDQQLLAAGAFFDRLCSRHHDYGRHLYLYFFCFQER